MNFPDNTSNDLMDIPAFLQGLNKIIPDNKDKYSEVTYGSDMLNTNNATPLGLPEDLYDDKPELYYKKATSRGILKANYRLALAIDPSQLGSGFAIYDNRGTEPVLHLESSTLSPIKDTKEDALNYFKMQREFHEDLLGVVSSNIKDYQDDVFDVIIIEDTVLSNANPQTFKKLVLLNHVVDHLIASNILKTNCFLRVNNKVWKKFLFSYKTGKQYRNVKREIEETLLYLDEPLVLDNYDKSKSWKNKTHYQDKLDAISMLITALDVKEYYSQESKKIKKHSFKYKLETTLPDRGTPVELANTEHRTLIQTIKQLQSEPRKSRYFMKVTRTQVGSWGIKHDLIFPIGIDEAYLLLY